MEERKSGGSVMNAGVKMLTSSTVSDHTQLTFTCSKSTIETVKKS